MITTLSSVMPSELPSFEASVFVSPSYIFCNAPSESMTRSALYSSIHSSRPSITPRGLPVSDGSEIPSESPSLSGAPSGKEYSRPLSISVS